ncbi:MAG: protein-L-isoaspartate(D-aspartate) O-methyltransferase [Elusimicrobiota bacterium]
MKDYFADLSGNFEKYFSFLNKKMIEEQLVKRGINNEKILKAFEKIKRHNFLPTALHSRAYDDYAIEIFPGQTISQPYITAFMLEKLKLKGNEKVLEIGTGSGYQTALLCLLAKEVFSIDIKENLKESAFNNLQKENLTNFRLFTADGKKGLKENAPYDAVIISCACERIPQEILNQTSPGARIIAPVGKEAQVLELLEKTENGFKSEKSLAVRFVPMI